MAGVLTLKRHLGQMGRSFICLFDILICRCMEFEAISEGCLCQRKTTEVSDGITGCQQRRDGERCVYR